MGLTSSLESASASKKSTIVLGCDNANAPSQYVNTAMSNKSEMQALELVIISKIKSKK